MVNSDFLREKIEFTNVNPFVSKREIDDFYKLALEYRVKTIYIPPVFLNYVHTKCRGRIDIGTTGGFPFGNVPLQIKLSEIEYAVDNKTRWIDVGLNLSNVKSQNWKNVEQEIYELKRKATEKKIGLKLIIETPYLTNKEIINVVEISEKTNIEFIKTASGVGNKVLLDHIKIIKPLLSTSKIKAAGGISTFYEVRKFFEYGADIIGSSKGFHILQEALNNEHPIDTTSKK